MGCRLKALAVGLSVLTVVVAGALESSELQRVSSRQSALRIEFQNRFGLPDFGAVALMGLPADLLAALDDVSQGSSIWADVFAIYTLLTGDICPKVGAQPAVLGTYRIDRSSIRFQPRFPFDAGLKYCARFDPSALEPSLLGAVSAEEVLESIFSLPLPDRNDSPKVEAVYPSGNLVPANLLRVYVHFSAPMRGKEVDKYIHLYDAEGEEVLLPFVEIPEGLWDPTGTRLTLFFHPGRVKRGVGPNLALGPPLEAGAGYRLVVGSGLQRVDGIPMLDDFVHEYTAELVDRESPNPEAWLVKIPGNPSDSLELVFPESLDHALVRRMIWVIDGQARRVEGAITLEDDETRWIFLPKTGWSTGDYSIKVDPSLEDLAGNGIDHLFEEPGTASSLEATTSRGVRAIPFSFQ